MIKTLKSYFSLEFRYFAFTDIVSGKSVNAYVDCFGDVWMKDGRWSLFRVRKCGAI